MAHRPVNGQYGKEWEPLDEVVQAIGQLRKNQNPLPDLVDVKKKVKDLNPKKDAAGNEVGSGRLLPGVKMEPYYDRTDLINVTTHTVLHNLVMGIVLESVVLLMFLCNIRRPLIVACNIPLALLFAFGMLFLRGKSANLLSIGAVDFGIIVDASVIMVENIYRHLSSSENAYRLFRDILVTPT